MGATFGGDDQPQGTTLTRWLAWTLCFLSLGLLPFALGLAVANRHAAEVWQIVEPQQFFVAVIYSVVGVLIALRRPGNFIGWLFLATGLTASVASLLSHWAVYGLETHPGLPGANAALWLGFAILAWSGFPTFPLLFFPSGHLVGWFTKTVAVVSAIASVTLVSALLTSSIVPPGFPELFDRTPSPFYLGEPIVNPFISVMTLLLCGLAASALLVLRFRRSRGTAREQYKWVVLTLVLVVAVAITDTIVRSEPSSWVKVTGPLFSASIALIPLAMGIAILRYKLWDIDVIISRVLTYGLLTALLLLGFICGVIFFQFLLDPLTGGNDLAVAGSTLLVAALFRPARNRLQRFVDRRFYRRKYDAQQTLQAFSLTARDAVQLDELTGGLTDVVARTVQPEHVSIWLNRLDLRKDQL